MSLVYIIAGEPSGDLLASRLMRAIQSIKPEVEFSGMGGETMAAIGFRSLFDISDISVMGIMEVVPKLPLIMQRLKQVIADIIDKRPDVIVTVDSWGFVHQVLKRLKKIGITTPKVHYVAPQVWAWKKNRAKTVARLTDKLITLLPYESTYFEKYGLECVFAGHPVTESVANLTNNSDTFRERYEIPGHATLITVLPGSRQNEIKRLVPVLLQVVDRLKKIFPHLIIVIPSVTAVSAEVKTLFACSKVPHHIVLGQAERYDAFRASSFAIAASGTVSLELAACKTPHIIVYRFGYATNKILKKFAGTRYANLINILADKFIIPEFVLENCRAELITPAIIDLMKNADKATAQVNEAFNYLMKLKPHGVMPSEKAADAVLSCIRSIN